MAVMSLSNGRIPTGFVEEENPRQRPGLSKGQKMKRRV